MTTVEDFFSRNRGANFSKDFVPFNNAVDHDALQDGAEDEDADTRIKPKRSAWSASNVAKNPEMEEAPRPYVNSHEYPNLSEFPSALEGGPEAGDQESGDYRNSGGRAAGAPIEHSNVFDGMKSERQIEADDDEEDEEEEVRPDANGQEGEVIYLQPKRRSRIPLHQRSYKPKKASVPVGEENAVEPEPVAETKAEAVPEPEKAPVNDLEKEMQELGLGDAQRQLQASKKKRDKKTAKKKKKRKH